MNIWGVGDRKDKSQEIHAGNEFCSKVSSEFERGLWVVGAISVKGTVSG